MSNPAILRCFEQIRYIAASLRRSVNPRVARTLHARPMSGDSNLCVQL